MSIRRLSFVTVFSLLVGCAFAVPSAVAEEPVFPFLEGLRQRGFFDTAEEYLDRLEASPKTPADIRTVIPYQRALNLIGSANQQRVAEAKHQRLERAAAQLEKFIKNNASHPMLGDAKTRHGNIFLGKAQAYSLEAKSPSNAARREELQAQAKQSIDKARSIFKSAHDEHQKRWKKFPAYIPPEQTAQLEQRRQAELDYMIAQRDLALTTYEEAQIYDRKNPKFAELLTKASKEFEAVHTKYRSQIVGLLCRMWQGKCFEEQGDIGRAEGIYKELMDHPGKSSALRTIQRQVFHFHLICLNHEKRKDYTLAAKQASDWLKKYPRYARTLTGLGIRYQSAIAREKLAAKRDIKASQKAGLLQAAQTVAQFINRVPSKYKVATTMMISRLKRARGLATEDPKNFPDAFSAAQVSLNNFQNVRDDLKKAIAQKKPKTEIQPLTVKLKNELEETSRLYRLALSLATPKDKPELVNRARYLLAFAYYLEGQIFKKDDRIYDTAVLSEFVARQLRVKDPQTASDAAYQAMAAYIRAYNSAPQGARQTEMAWITRSALFITNNWPSSERAADATFNLGAIYEKKREYLNAARWFIRVPKTSQDQYPEALVSAGLNYWAHYSIAATITQDRKSMTTALKAAADQDLATAIADLMNPSWQEARRIERMVELDLYAAKKAAKDAPDGKKPAAKGTPAVNPRDRELQNLRKQSVTELRQAMAKLTSKPVTEFQAATEAELRKRVVGELRKSARPTLQTQFDDRLAELDDDSLVKLFQSRIEHWRTAGAWYLKTGIESKRAQLSETSATPETLVRAKALFSEYLLGDGRYRSALTLLNQAPHDVMGAIKVDDDSKRPADSSLKGRDFASFTYQLLARCYIGVRETKKFRDTMAVMEKIASGEDDQHLTAIYERIGRDTQKQIEQLRNRNQPERLKEELDNFQSIISGLLERSDKLEYNTLIWAAETAYGLGEGLGADAAATVYFEQAAKAYQLILDSNSLNITADQRINVQLRQINCNRRQNKKDNFDEAIALAKAIVKDKPRMLPAHFEAALTYEDWAASGQPDKYLDAINGSKEDKLWGWSGIAEQLRQSVMNNRNKGAAGGMSPQKLAEYDQKYLQARYHQTYCRLKYGEAQSAQPTDPKRQQALGNALREMFDFVANVGLIEGRQFEDVKTRKLVDAKTRFDDLSRKIQLAMGKDSSQIVALKWAKPEEVKPVIVKKGPTTKTGETATTPSKTELVNQDEKKKTEETGSSPLGMIFGILFMLAALGGGGWFLFKTMGKPRKRPMAYGSLSGGGFDAASFTPPTETRSSRPATAKRKPRPAGKPAATAQKQRSAGKPSGGKTSAEKPAARKPAAGKPKKRSERPPSQPG